MGNLEIIKFLDCGIWILLYRLSHAFYRPRLAAQSRTSKTLWLEMIASSVSYVSGYCEYLAQCFAAELAATKQRNEVFDQSDVTLLSAFVIGRRSTLFIKGCFSREDLPKMLYFFK